MRIGARSLKGSASGHVNDEKLWRCRKLSSLNDRGKEDLTGIEKRKGMDEVTPEDHA